MKKGALSSPNMTRNIYVLLLLLGIKLLFVGHTSTDDPSIYCRTETEQEGYRMTSNNMMMLENRRLYVNINLSLVLSHIIMLKPSSRTRNGDNVIPFWFTMRPTDGSTDRLVSTYYYFDVCLVWSLGGPLSINKVGGRW